MLLFTTKVNSHPVLLLFSFRKIYSVLSTLIFSLVDVYCIVYTNIFDIVNIFFLLLSLVFINIIFLSYFIYLFLVFIFYFLSLFHFLSHWGCDNIEFNLSFHSRNCVTILSLGFLYVIIKLKFFIYLFILLLFFTLCIMDVFNNFSYS